MKYLRTEFSLFLFHSLNGNKCTAQRRMGGGERKFRALSPTLNKIYNVQDTKPESLLSETIYKKKYMHHLYINITTSCLGTSLSFSAIFTPAQVDCLQISGTIQSVWNSLNKNML